MGLYGPHDPEVFSSRGTRRVTGASGLLGGNLAADSCTQSRGRRDAETGTKVAHLDDLEIVWLDAELRSAPDLTKAFEGAGAVFHCAAAVTVKREVTPEMTAANVTGTQNVIDACVAAKVSGSCTRRRSSPSGSRRTASRATRPRDWNFDTEGLVDGTRSRSDRPRRSSTHARDRIDCGDRQPRRTCSARATRDRARAS